MTRDMVGRDLGAALQHEDNNFHHSSVIREHVSSSVGRSGGPFIILLMAARPRQQWNGSFRVNSSRAVIPNDHTSVAADGLPNSNISGAIQRTVPPNSSGTGTLKEELVRYEKPKSARSGLPSSDISTLAPFRSPWKTVPGSRSCR